MRGVDDITNLGFPRKDGFTNFLTQRTTPKYIQSRRLIDCSHYNDRPKKSYSFSMIFTSNRMTSQTKHSNITSFSSFSTNSCLRIFLSQKKLNMLQSFSIRKKKSISFQYLAILSLFTSKKYCKGYYYRLYLFWGLLTLCVQNCCSR